jgi:hypothetical protein
MKEQHINRKDFKKFIYTLLTTINKEKTKKVSAIFINFSASKYVQKVGTKCHRAIEQRQLLKRCGSTEKYD